MNRRRFISLLGLATGATISDLYWQKKIERNKEKDTSIAALDRECCNWLVTPIGININDSLQKTTLTPDPKIINEFLFFDPTNKNLTIDCSESHWSEKRFSDFKLTFHQCVVERYTIKALQKDDDILLQFYSKTGNQSLYSTVTFKNHTIGNRIKEIAVIGDDGNNLFVAERLLSSLRTAKDWQTNLLNPLNSLLKDFPPSAMPPVNDAHSSVRHTRKELAQAITDQRSRYLVATERGMEREQSIVIPKQTFGR
jgi:hypothetical protein